ncbi:MAG: hypothetical protein SCJ94_04775 [Bacillota bacterium]|nr:hypothetical protein [Bacillota bacterium]
MFNKIRDEVKLEDIYPMIHFECHGSPDGLYVTNGEFITWQELRRYLIDINYACRLNLVIVLAACNGYHIIKVAEKLDRAPFLLIIGPEGEVSTGDVERDFDAFYASFFDDLDGYAALNSLNRSLGPSAWKYHIMSAEALFINAYVKYYKENCTGKRKRERIENLITKGMKDPRVQNFGVGKTRKLIKQKLTVANEEHFNRKKKQFFFVDEFPDNMKRFPFSFNDVLIKV